MNGKFLRRNLLLFSAFVLLLTALNLRTLDNPFLHDDIHSIRDNPHISSLKNIPRFFVDPTLFSSDPYAAMYRPIVLVSLAFNHAVSGYSPWSYRLLNIIIHALNAVLLIFLVKKWKKMEFLPLVIMGAIFLLSPLSCYPVFLVSARSALFYGTFLLASLLCYESALEKISGQEFWGFLVVSLVAFLLGLLSNAVCVMISAFIFLRSLAWFHENQAAAAQKWKFVASLFSFAVLTTAYLFLHKSVAGTTFGEDYVRPVTVNIMLQLKLLYVYLKMFLYPFDYPLYYTFKEPSGIMEPLVLLAFCATFLWTLSALKRFFSPRRFDGFLMLMPLVAYFPYAAIPLNVPLAEHHFYVSLMGIAALIALSFQELMKEHKRVVVACFAVICIAFSLVIIHRGRIWDSEFALSSNTAKLSPSNTLAWDDLGISYMNAEKYEKALWAYSHSLKLEPKNMGALYNLGTTYFYMKKYDDAVEALMKYREMMSRHKPTYYEDGIIGMALVRQGKFLEALSFLDSAILNGIQRSDIYIDKISVLVQLGRAREAVPLCKEVQSLDGRNPDGLLWCARAEYASGNLQGAVSYMDKLFGMGVYNPDTVFLGVSILRAAERGDQAMRMVEGALAKWGDSGKLWMLKGILLEDLNMTDEALDAYKKALDLGLPPEIEAEVGTRIAEMNKQKRLHK